MNDDRHGPEHRVLILAPNRRDAARAESVIRDARIDCCVCPSMAELVREIEVGAGTVLTAEEALGDEGGRPLTAALARQQSWSDLPVLILTRPGADSPAVAQALETLGNVTLLERPIRIASLVSALRAALRARQRQYQIRSQLRDREQAAEKLKEADRRKDEFLATLAHELRNPLAPIRNSLHILREAGRGDTGLGPICAIMERQVNHMVRLVDDLLELSRITRGQIELRREKVDLATVVHAAVETSQPLIDAADHRLQIELPDEPLWIEADPVRMAQVFANLLNNAAKYMDSGGLIRISARSSGGTVSVTVADQGIGIDADMLDGVFEMFTQGQPSRRTQDGLGIGLTLVRSLIEMHGGRIQASSAGRGCGSEFTVCLPLTAAPRRRHADTAGLGDSGLPRRILVVDDNRDAADSLGLYLELLGIEVLVVHDGESALRSLAQFAPEVVLLDIGMPGMDGHEVARRARSQAAYDGVVFIALTGWGQDKDRIASRAAGIDHHMIKPVDLPALETLLRSLAGASPRRLPLPPASAGRCSAGAVAALGRH